MISTNILSSAFTCEDPKIAKKYSQAVSLFYAFGTPVNPLHKTLVKLTPWVDFTNILLSSFTHTDPKSAKIQSSHQSFCVFGTYKCKSCAQNISKIDTLSWFKQHLTCRFYAPRSQKRKKYSLLGSVLVKALSKMLVKSTPGFFDCRHLRKIIEKFRNVFEWCLCRPRSNTTRFEWSESISPNIWQADFWPIWMET